MKSARDVTELDCPGCGGKFRVSEPEKQGSVNCPHCGKEWRVRLQDVPGSRFLIDLGPLAT